MTLRIEYQTTLPFHQPQDMATTNEAEGGLVASVRLEPRPATLPIFPDFTPALSVTQRNAVSYSVDVSRVQTHSNRRRRRRVGHPLRHPPSQHLPARADKLRCHRSLCRGCSVGGRACECPPFFLGRGECGRPRLQAGSLRGKSSRSCLCELAERKRLSKRGDCCRCGWQFRELHSTTFK